MANRDAAIGLIAPRTAHLNLNDEYLPYKHLIGQVLLDVRLVPCPMQYPSPADHAHGTCGTQKNRVLRTVVNKLDSIDSEFRVFKMEVIAGDGDLITTVVRVRESLSLAPAPLRGRLHDGPHIRQSESGCRFTFDFSTVYWNSRLAHEHERLIGIFRPGEVVADVMAGVGPFAVPAARKGCLVLGNDLNPESTRWMERNRVDNRVRRRVSGCAVRQGLMCVEATQVQQTLRVRNIDGREFIRTAAVQAYTEPFPLVSAPPSETKRLAKEARRAREAAKKAREADGEAEGEDREAAARAAPAITGVLPSAPAAPPIPQHISHFVMNLPGSALEFLDAYSGCYRALLNIDGFPGNDVFPMPLVHTHCFTKEAEGEGAQRDICEVGDAVHGPAQRSLCPRSRSGRRATLATRSHPT